ncbi:hypothetical protein PCORN_18369 [Listeria cornellensis FSL F6-0969]|uniref:Uncharacterized protein n=1 Tax=Listeria cornellensis FSL F6-0969 TaxID=1265820 RepID=W7BK50_9LIST|nr:hypothetical protein PCORN_18369 [Listeria cornellensis FSL F6-0969]
MIILGIDTSNDTLGISLWRDNKVVGEFVTNLKKKSQRSIITSDCRVDEGM